MPLELKELRSDMVLVTISSFQFGLDKLRKETLNKLQQNNYNTIVIDLRNNPGGSLEDVEHMLDYIVPSGQPSVILRDIDRDIPYISQGAGSGFSLTDKNIIILINK